MWAGRKTFSVFFSYRVFGKFNLNELLARKRWLNASCSPSFSPILFRAERLANGWPAHCI